MKLQRSYQKRITREARVLRFMRQSKRLSLNQAGKKVCISGSAIAHMEQGRMDISRARLATLIDAYGYTMAEFLELHDDRVLPTDLRAECIQLLRLCDESKINVLHPVISNLTK